MLEPVSFAHAPTGSSRNFQLTPRWLTVLENYGDRCGIARALDAVGDRWALLVVRELLLGPKRFTDLRAGLPRVSPDVLAQRLRELEAVGVLRRDSLPPPAASQVYELTERGRELETGRSSSSGAGAAASRPTTGRSAPTPP